MKVPSSYYVSNTQSAYIEAFEKIAARESARTGVFVGVKVTDRHISAVEEIQFDVGGCLCNSLVELRKVLRNKAFI